VVRSRRANVRRVAYRFSLRRAPIRQRRETSNHVNRRNLRDAFLTVFGVISVVNGAFGNGHLLIALLGAVALAIVAWQRWQSRRAASV
jgi:Flp pilus assembly protein TadB